MANKDKKPICLLNYKAKLIAYYESISDFIKLSGFPSNSVYHAFRNRTIYRNMLIIEEREYRKHWEEGTISELQFKTKAERDKDKIKPMTESKKRKDVEYRRRNKLREAIQQRKVLGLPMPWQISATSTSRPVICLDTNVVYPSINEAARQIGISTCSIHRAVTRNYKSRGLTFRYVNDSIIEIKNHSPD